MLKIGERLQKERLRKGLTLPDVAKATKIRQEFLAAIETGDYKKLPSSAYIQGFIRNYAEFLELSVKETLAMFRREFDEREYIGVLPKSFTRKQKNLLSGLRFGSTTFVVALIVIFVVGYILFQYRSAFLSPGLSVVSPTENAVVVSQIVTITGKTEQNTTLTVNDLPVYIDKDGNFRKDLSVFSGQTTIVIKAENNFGRKTTILRHITVQ